MKNVLVLHGPNLNLLGEREPAIYGTATLAQVNAMIRLEARRLGLSVRVFQKNGEGELIDLLHRHRKWADGIVINPAAYTHYSYALRDALAAVAKPVVEVHLSDISRRERWRRVSVIAQVCRFRVMGRGPRGYEIAMKLLSNRITKKSRP